jgi:prevent-host-death family protein
MTPPEETRRSLILTIQSLYGIIYALKQGGISMNINLKEDIRPISYIKTHAADMLNYINDHKNPIIVTQNGEARGVLLDVESYQNMIDALSLMKLIQISENSISEGKLHKNKDVFAELRKNIEAI